MSNKKNLLIINIILLTALLCFANSGMAAEPVELEALRESFTTAKQSVINEGQRKDVINNYIQQLTDLATDLRIYKNDRAGTNAVRKEIRKAKKELDADPATLTAAPEPVVSKPEPTPIVVQPSPQPIVPEPAAKIAAKPISQPVVPAPEPKPIVAKVTQKPIEPKPTPKIALDKPTPNPIKTKPAASLPLPKPDLTKPVPAPKPVATKPTPKPIMQKKPAPKPVVAKPTSKTVMQKKPAPKSVVAKPTPKPVTQKKPAPKAVVTKPPPKPITQKKPAPKPVVAKPAPKPVTQKKPETKPAVAKPIANLTPAKEHTPQTHVSSVQGLAGNAKTNQNNVYTFNLSGIGSSSTLAFWATGKNSLDTYGKVWLITPEGRRIIVGIWKESYFTAPSTDITSFYQIQPITEDITKKVSGPGTYKIEFEWTDGKDPLVIYRVEITS